MGAMLHLSEQQVQSLVAAPNKPVEISDDDTKMSFVVLSRDAFQYVEPFLIERNLREAELREALQVGIDQKQRGEVDDWNIDAVIKDAHDAERGSPPAK